MAIRWFIITAIVALSLWFALKPNPPSPLVAAPASSPEKPVKRSPTQTSSTSVRRVAKKLKSNDAPDASVLDKIVSDAVVEEIDAEVKPKGPFAIDLGTHTIYLKDPEKGRHIRVQLTATTRTDAGRIQVLRRKSRLIKMLFFLASKRNPKAVTRADAQDRLEADLYNRFVQVVPGNALTGLTIDSYEVLEKTKAAEESEAP